MTPVHLGCPLFLTALQAQPGARQELYVTLMNSIVPTNAASCQCISRQGDIAEL
jgi:hypothetical protein